MKKVTASVVDNNLKLEKSVIEIDKEELATETSQNIESVDNSESINIEETINETEPIESNETDEIVEPTVAGFVGTDISTNSETNEETIDESTEETFDELKKWQVLQKLLLKK